jgi:hypothetical protein
MAPWLGGTDGYKTSITRLYNNIKCRYWHIQETERSGELSPCQDTTAGRAGQTHEGCEARVVIAMAAVGPIEIRRSLGERTARRAVPTQRGGDSDQRDI